MSFIQNRCLNRVLGLRLPAEVLHHLAVGHRVEEDRTGVLFRPVGPPHDLPPLQVSLGPIAPRL